MNIVHRKMSRGFSVLLAVLALSTYSDAVATVVTVNWKDLHQKMDGFGGGVVFLSPGSLDPVASTNMDTLFGTNNASQLGLTLLRVRIDPTTNWVNAALDAQGAVARGAGVLATPWTPPASMKDNNTLTNGGSVLTNQYVNYCSYLKNFAAYVASSNAPLRAISIQNEPDFLAAYESCLWNSNQFLAFFRTNAGNFGSTPIMMPESLRFDNTLSDPTLNNAVTGTNVSLVGGHLYSVTTIPANTNALARGKPVWMTEYLTNDQTIGTAILTAGQINDCLTAGNMSAYIWWKCLGDSNGLVNASGVPQLRGFVMAQWSRFVRPGYYRIGANPSDGALLVTAFRDTNSVNFAIVAVNTNASTGVSQTFILTNFTAASVTPWITSGTLSLAVQPAVTVTNSSFIYTVPATSIVTFVGQGNTPPVLAPVVSRTNNVGLTLLITNTATDSDLPPQTLAFGPAGVFPANANLNSSNGIFSWRPSVSQANTTNLIFVQVTDSGSPPLSATNNFTIFVNPVTNPVINAIALSTGRVNLTVNGPDGPDYTLFTSTNLFNWQALYTTNSPVTPLILTDTNATEPARFYRLQIGP